MRRSCVAAVAAALLLAGCRTTVSGTGRPAAAGGPATGGAATGGASSPAPLDLWREVVDGVTQLPAVTASGPFTGAGFGGVTGVGVSTIEATFGGGDGGPRASAVITTTAAGSIEVRATGGSAWAKASAAFYTLYAGYTPDQIAAAADRWVVLTDDGTGLDVFASLTVFLEIAGVDDTLPEDLSTRDTVVDGTPAVVIGDTVLNSDVTVTADPPRVLRSQSGEEDVVFGYDGDPLVVEAPPAAEVVTVPGF